VEEPVTKLQDKAQGQTKQIVGQMTGDEELVREGKEQARKAGEKQKPSKDNADRR